MTKQSKDAQLTEIEDRAFRRLRQRADALAAQIVRRLDEIMDGMPDIVAPQTAVDFLASGLMENDEQAFRWLLESYAAMKIQEIDAAKANLHSLHLTTN
jgi:hypothetical protein